ncbi:kinase-like domain-containing protein [Cantharellus anzutake]|uniref:kinase-like domain-containing protein n=1 Tax=Cantharellus anzutake TaxID=1750568 RepID=UPI0019036C12|nr:kinase-like domain-containing protein [Cantharellus anzutake]KAF8311231.1 kinase-like domain-containing protein [Cantharellus anzutake]
MEVIHEVDLSREEAEHFVQRVERQLKMLRSLIYTNIARFQEWIVNLEDKTWLRARVTYAGCEGGKVMDYLSANVNADRQRLILGVSRGLSYLHSNDVVHGNLNPGNIHIGHDVGDENPIPRISGFGFSYAMRDEPVHLKVEGAFSVSLRYIAPEILAGDGVPCDRKGDVWSLGSTLSYSSVDVPTRVSATNTTFYSQSWTPTSGTPRVLAMKRFRGVSYAILLSVPPSVKLSKV